MFVLVSLKDWQPPTSTYIMKKLLGQQTLHLGHQSLLWNFIFSSLACIFSPLNLQNHFNEMNLLRQIEKNKVGQTAAYKPPQNKD